MGEAILVIGHGSRDPEGNREFISFVARLKEKLPQRIVEPCFLELAEPDIQTGVDACVAQGARQITFLPMLLFAAGHMKVEIPEQLAAAEQRHPGVSMNCGRHIGIHGKVLDILQERVMETGGKAAEGDTTAVLMVGRGSSDPEANGEMFKVSRLLWERLPGLMVETAFMGITGPTLAQGLDRCLRLGAKRVIVLPYFLFTGVLINRMKEMVERFQGQYPDHCFRVAGYLGPHCQLVDVLVERALEVPRMAIQSM